MFFLDCHCPLPHIHTRRPVLAPQQSEKVRTRKLRPVSTRHPARIDRLVLPTRYPPMSNAASGSYLMAWISLRSANGISRNFPRFLADHLLHAVAKYAPAACYNYLLHGLPHRARRPLNIAYTERNIREAAPRPYDQEDPDAWIPRAGLCNSYGVLKGLVKLWEPVAVDGRKTRLQHRCQL